MHPAQRRALVLLVLASACGGDDAAAPNQPPTADFTASCTDLSCTFTDASTDSDGSVTGWSWTFGDEGAATEQSPSHTYTAGGTYNVTLTATDDDGATATATKPVSVTAPPITSALLCTNPTTKGNPILCTLTLDEPAGVKAAIAGVTTCEAHGNFFGFTAPEAVALTTDGCFESPGKQVTLAGPFAAGTVIRIEVGVNPPLANPPAVQVEGTYPSFTLRLEDGVDLDFDDLTYTVTVLPAP